MWVVKREKVKVIVASHKTHIWSGRRNHMLNDNNLARMSNRIQLWHFRSDMDVELQPDWLTGTLCAAVAFVPVA